MPSRLLLNHRTSVLPVTAAPSSDVHLFHRRLPGYAPTPLRDVPALAEACGVGRVLVKDESSRLGLPSFKILGASWATYRGLCARLGGEPDWTTLEELAVVVARRLGPLRLVTASDGNHGRAVAHMARLLHLSATILVPEGTAAARVEAIDSEGAEVVEVPGTYDDAVTISAEMAGEGDLLVSDTSWPGYDDLPRRVVEGYTTIFTEVDADLEAGVDGVGLDEQGGDPSPAGEGVVVAGGGLEVPDPLALDVVVVPLGVGALGAAAGVSWRAGLEPGDGPLLVGVEPLTAACVAAAVEAGHVVEVPGPHRSIMAGLNCGLASMVALPTVQATFEALVAVDDDTCRRAVGAHAGAGMDLGETGAAALAGLLAVVEEHRDELPLPAGANVLLLATEGVTDPVGFERIVGRPPR